MSESRGMRDLTPKQHRFVEEYLVDLNATQAYLRAGYKASEEAARRNAARLLTKADIQAAIALEINKRSDRTEITQDRVLKEYARLAFFDPRKLFDSTGRPKAIHELDDDTAAVVAGLDVVNVGNAELGEGEVLKFKLADKKGALDSVARHLGMFNDKLDLTVNTPLADRLARARERNGDQ